MAEASFPNFQSNCPSAMWALLVQVKRDTLARDTGGKSVIASSNRKSLHPIPGALLAPFVCTA